MDLVFAAVCSLGAMMFGCFVMMFIEECKDAVSKESEGR